jgi:hypothetical protein
MVRGAHGIVAAIHGATPEHIPLVAGMGVAMAMDVDRRKGHFMGHLILLHR